MSPKSLTCMHESESDNDDLDDDGKEGNSISVVSLEDLLLGNSSVFKSGIFALSECFLGVDTPSSSVELFVFDETIALRRRAVVRSDGEKAGNDWMSTCEISGGERECTVTISGTRVRQVHVHW